MRKDTYVLHVTFRILYLASRPRTTRAWAFRADSLLLYQRLVRDTRVAGRLNTLVNVKYGVQPEVAGSLRSWFGYSKLERNSGPSPWRGSEVGTEDRKTQRCANKEITSRLAQFNYCTVVLVFSVVWEP
jgi:hypothetical protein